MLASDLRMFVDLPPAQPGLNDGSHFSNHMILILRILTGGYLPSKGGIVLKHVGGIVVEEPLTPFAIEWRSHVTQPHSVLSEMLLLKNKMSRDMS